MEILKIDIEKPEDMNFILGQSHFIKTIEDIYEICVTTVPQMKFGLAFCEASGPRLIRHIGNDKDLEDLAVKNAKNIGAGHSFILFIKEAYPINILNQIKNCPEVCCIYCATANPTTVLLVENGEGRGIIGVIDGKSPLGIESSEDINKRHRFLRTIGYKK